MNQHADHCGGEDLKRDKLQAVASSEKMRKIKTLRVIRFRNCRRFHYSNLLILR